MEGQARSGAGRGLFGSGSEAWALCSRSLGRKPEGRSPSLRTRSTRGGSFCHTSMCTERVHQPAGLDPATALSRDDLVVADPRTDRPFQP
jgi:hypothetical protein